jgi:choline dehydrogenase
MHATSVPPGNELVDAFIAASQQLGRRVNDFNTGDQEGVGYFQLSTRKGFRCSTAVGYLKPAMPRSNLHVETEAQAAQILFADKRAVGVKYRQAGQFKEVRARRKCCCAPVPFSRPSFCSFPAWVPRVARAVRHPAGPLPRRRRGEPAGSFAGALDVRGDQADYDERSDAFAMGQGEDGVAVAVDPSGPLAVGINMGGMFCRALPEENATPDIQFHFANLSADSTAGAVHDFPAAPTDLPAPAGIAWARAHQFSDPFQAPSIVANYLYRDDRRTTIAGVKFARQVTAAGAMAPYMKGVSAGSRCGDQR